MLKESEIKEALVKGETVLMRGINLSESIKLQVQIIFLG